MHASDLIQLIQFAWSKVTPRAIRVSRPTIKVEFSCAPMDMREEREKVQGAEQSWDGSWLAEQKPANPIAQVLA